MITLRPSETRGHADHGWLNARHSFSFANWYDPRYMGFRALRVINDDRVAAGAGFPTHGHQDMEIVTYVLDGALEHRDSMGNGAVLKAGDMQRMSAGSGVRHSEFNPSRTEQLRLLQIWLLPQARGIEPGYEDKSFPLAERQDQIKPLVTPDGRDGTLKIHQDASVHGVLLGAGVKASYGLAPGRHGWVQVAKGTLRLGSHTLREGDAAMVSDERQLEFEGLEQGAEALLFDLA
jgi:redox-sensitive bicupin YhaK (pirin superfamily)